MSKSIKSSESEVVFTRSEAAEYIGYSIRYLEELCYKHKIPYFKLRGRSYFKKKELDNWLFANKIEVKS